MTQLNWNDIYPELVNKLRWSISTAFATPESNYPFRDSQAMATVFAQEIVDLVKLAQTEPGVTMTPGSIRGWKAQKVLDRL